MRKRLEQDLHQKGRIRTGHDLASFRAPHSPNAKTEIRLGRTSGLCLAGLSEQSKRKTAHERGK